MNLSISYVKAVGIILMVLAHSNSLSFIDHPIGMFHMPLFFIVSGYCLKEKYFSMPHTFVWRKIKSLWWLFVKYSLLFIVFHNLFYSLNFYNEHFWNQHIYTREDFLHEFIGVFLHMENHELMLRQFWFVKTLFWANLIAFVVLFVINNIINRIKLLAKYRTWIYSGLILAGGIAVLFLNSIHKTFTVFYISPREFLAALFIIIGYSMALLRIKNFSVGLIVLSFTLLIINSFYCFFRMKSDFYDTEKILFYSVTAVLATWSVYSLPWHRLSTKVAKMMQYIGDNTLPILVWHFLCFKAVSLLIVMLYDLPYYEVGAFHVIYDYADKGWFIVYTIVGICIPLAFKQLGERIRLSLKRSI